MGVYRSALMLHLLSSAQEVARSAKQFPCLPQHGFRLSTPRTVI
jgi:hypothetical protein